MSLLTIVNQKTISMKKLCVFLTSLLFVGVQLVQAQTVRITGTVTGSEDGMPLPGVSVVVKGATTVGVATNIDGKYELNAPASATTLEFSFIGYETQSVEIAGRSVIDVTLAPSSEQLEEVMVVAYGTAKKESFTGSATAVSEKQISKLQVSNVTKALEGAVPGIQVSSSSGQPGSSATIRIRGIGSINASSDPLYVVDGMPYDGSISAINAADIESMTVLKDAASTALYGSRAANGVIIITTKKGSDLKSTVKVEARYGVNSRGVSEYDIMKSPEDYVLTYWQLLKNQTDAATASATILGDLGYNPFIGNNGVLVDENGNLVSTTRRYTDDWAKEAFINGARQEYNIGIEGGNDKMKQYMSVGYLNDEGIIRNSGYTRYSTRMNMSYKATDFLDLNGSMAYSRGEQNSQQISSTSNYVNSFMFSQMIAPIYPVYAYDADGNKLYDANGDPLFDFGDGTYGARAYGSNQNIVASDDANMNRNTVDQISARGGLNIKFLKDFTFSARVGFDSYNSNQDQFVTPTFGDSQTVGGRVYKTNSGVTTFTANQIINYNKKFGEHTINALVGHESYRYTSRSFYAAKHKVYDPENVEFNNAIIMDAITSSSGEETLESYLAGVNYDLNDKYYASASVRTDGSSRFAKDNRWGVFWSVGASWRISEEDFLSSATWLDNLTLKASFGTVGNNAIPNLYAYQAQYSIQNDGSDNFSVSQTYWGNEDLTWETSNNFNVGIESKLLDGKVTFAFDYFTKKTVDMLYNMPYPPSSGISYIPVNQMTMTNNGFEFSLGVTPIRTDDLTLEFLFTGTKYNNKVSDLPEAKKVTGITSGMTSIREGGSVYDYWYFKYAGVANTGDVVAVKDADGNYVEHTVGEDGFTDITAGRGVYYNAAGQKTLYANLGTEDKYFLGTAIPDFIGGLTVNLTYKGFDFSVGANYQLGGLCYDSFYAALMHGGDAGTNWHNDMLNAWTTENTDSDIPMLSGAQDSNERSDRFLTKAAYFNLRNITLGYTLPENWSNAIKLSTARVYVTADNVAIFTSRKGLDSRQNISGSTDYNYSAIRSVSFGISLTL